MRDSIKVSSSADEKQVEAQYTQFVNEVAENLLVKDQILPENEKKLGGKLDLLDKAKILMVQKLVNQHHHAVRLRRQCGPTQ